MLGESVPPLAHRARAVVGGALDHDRDPGRTIAFIVHFFVMRAFELAGTALDGALDGVPGHVLIRGLVEGGARARVKLRPSPATGARRHGDLADYLGENLAAPGVLHAFAVLDIGPFRMAGHGDSRGLP